MIWLMGICPALFILLLMVPWIQEVQPAIAMLGIVAWLIWTFFWMGLVSLLLRVWCSKPKVVKNDH